MSLDWITAIYQMLVFGLLILFFVGLYKFVKTILGQYKSTKQTLKRIEDKLDLLIDDSNRN